MGWVDVKELFRRGGKKKKEEKRGRRELGEKRGEMRLLFTTSFL